MLFCISIFFQQHLYEIHVLKFFYLKIFEGSCGILKCEDDGLSQYFQSISRMESLNDNSYDSKKKLNTGGMTYDLCSLTIKAIAKRFTALTQNMTRCDRAALSSSTCDHVQRMTDNKTVDISFRVLEIACRLSAAFSSDSLFIRRSSSIWVILTAI